LVSYGQKLYDANRFELVLIDGKVKFLANFMIPVKVST